MSGFPHFFKHSDLVFQHVDLFLDVPVRAELFADRLDRVALAFREHVVPDKLPRSVGHFQCDCAFFHRHKAVAVDITENLVIQRADIRLAGRIDAV